MLLTGGGCACDRCGWVAENEGVVHFVTVSDIRDGDPATGKVEQLHFCREKGCAGKVRTPSMITAKTEREKPSG